MGNIEIANNIIIQNKEKLNFFQNTYGWVMHKDIVGDDYTIEFRGFAEPNSKDGDIKMILTYNKDRRDNTSLFFTNRFLNTEASILIDLALDKLVLDKEEKLFKTKYTSGGSVFSDSELENFYVCVLDLVAFSFKDSQGIYVFKNINYSK